MTSIPSNILSYLRGAGYRIEQGDMTPHWCAIALGCILPERYLVEAGIDFTGIKDASPYLPKLSEILTKRQQEGTSVRIQAHLFQKLKAFIGSRRVKTSELRDEDDYWMVAEILWPDYVTRRDGMGLGDLLYQIERIPKKKRRTANNNHHKLPEYVRSFV